MDELYTKQHKLEEEIRLHFREIHWLEEELREVKASIKEDLDRRQRAYDERRAKNGTI